MDTTEECFIKSLILQALEECHDLNLLDLIYKLFVLGAP